MKEAIELLEKVVEAQYQKVDGFCPWCGAKDYPVRGDKRDYEEVKAEDAEEWHIDHSEDCIVVYLDQAIELLKQPKCDTCGGSGKIPRKEKQHCRLRLCADLSIPICFRCQFYIHESPCPDCQQPKDQPGSEFTKKFRELIKLSEEHLSDNKIGRLQTYGKEACKIIDTSEASRKELLEALEKVQQYRIAAEKGGLDPDNAHEYWESVMSYIEAAIAKAEKEG
jgi:hypothetical protein